MIIEEEKILDARLVQVKGVRYLRMNSFPGAPTFSWFEADGDDLTCRFMFKWLGQKSMQLEMEYQVTKTEAA